MELIHQVTSNPRGEFSELLKCTIYHSQFFFILSELDWEVKKIVITNLLEKNCRVACQTWWACKSCLAIFGNCFNTISQQIITYSSSKIFLDRKSFIGLDYKIIYFHWMVRYFSILATIALDWQEWNFFLIFEKKVIGTYNDA